MESLRSLTQAGGSLEPAFGLSGRFDRWTKSSRRWFAFLRCPVRTRCRAFWGLLVWIGLRHLYPSVHHDVDKCIGPSRCAFGGGGLAGLRMTSLCVDHGAATTS